jgi:DNA-binding transcriptional regulator LsrR (DeoR family)
LVVKGKAGALLHERKIHAKIEKTGDNLMTGKQKKSKDTKNAKERFSLAQLDTRKRREIQETFARELLRFLEIPDDGKKPITKEEVIRNLNRLEIVDCTIEVRQFDNLLRSLHADQYLRIGFRRLSELCDKLREQFRGLREVTVVAGADKDNFAQAAAEDFILQLARIGKIKKENRAGGAEPVLHVGIVSGRTTGTVIRAATNMSWIKNLGVNASLLPKVRVFALNVCLTVPENLQDNSTVLAYQLAGKINAEAKDESKAMPYGLSAPLLVEKDRLPEVDREPQTFEVVQFTEPHRVREKLKQMKKQHESLTETTTELDVVLTGVGEKPPVAAEGSRSIFYSLAREFDFPLDKIFQENRVVGDIAFTAISADGEAVPLRKTRSTGTQDRRTTTGTGDDVEYVFYSAVQLPVLEAMARDENKAVILVARDAEKADKVPAIYASIGGHHRYASVLIVDEQTAQRLRRF